MRIGQTSFITFVSKVLSSAAGFIATIYFARVLGDEILGTYYYLLAVVGWLSLLGTMGVGSALTKRMSEGEDIAEFKGAGALIIGGFAIFISITILVLHPILMSILEIQMIEFLIILIVVSLAGTYVDSMLQGLHLVHIYAMLKPVRGIVRTGIQIGAVLIGWQLMGLVFGYVFGGVFIIVIGLYVVGSNYRIPTRNHILRLLDYAKYAWMGRLEGKTFNQADMLLLGLLVPVGAVGVYGVTWNIAVFLLIFSTAISSAIFPEISKLSYQDNKSGVINLVENSLAFTGLFTIPGLLGGALLAEEIMMIYGTDFQRGSQVLWLLILSILFYGYQRQFVNAMNGIDRPDEAFKVNGVLIGSNILLNVILIIPFGMIGAALATASSSILSAFYGYRITNRHLNISLPLRNFAKQTISGIFMGVMILILQRLLPNISQIFTAEILTISLIILGATIYFGVLLILSEDFRKVVNDNMIM